MVLYTPHSWIEKYLMNRLQYREDVFIMIVPHIVFLFDLAEVQDVVYAYLVKQ